MTISSLESNSQLLVKLQKKLHSGYENRDGIVLKQEAPKNNNPNQIKNTTAQESKPKQEEKARQADKNEKSTKEEKEKKVSLTEKYLEEIKEDLNNKLAMQNIKLDYSLDKDTKTLVVKVLNSQSGELIRQIPPEAVLNLTKSMQEISGLLVDEWR